MLSQKLLGQTGISVSRIGLGTVKFGRNEGVKYPEHFSLPDDKTIKDLLSLAQEMGVNLLDTAPAYGESERRLGELLSPFEKSKWTIISKAGERFENGVSSFDFSPSGIEKSVEQSLKHLKRDYIDVLLVHSDGQDLHYIEDDLVFVTLDKLKQQGKIRSYGMSTKTIEGGLKTLECSDVAMVTYNPKHLEELPILEQAKRLNKGILIKKAFASGHLRQEYTVPQMVKFVLAHEGVTSLITGTLNLKHLKETILAAL